MATGMDVTGVTRVEIDMAWIEEHWLRLFFVAAYLAMLVHHCRVSKQHTSRLEDYLIAGRGLGGWVVALSFYATFVSTNTFIGQAGKSWDVGLIWYVKLVVFAVFCYLSWYLIAPRFVAKAKEYNSLTVADFIGFRYDSTLLRRASALVIVVASTLYLTAIYKGSALALQQFLGLEYRTAAVAIFIVVTAYTVAGGFRSVVLTDAVQGLLMAIGAIAMLVAVVAQGGGVGAILETLRAQDPNLVSWKGNMPLMAILGLALSGGVKLLVEPRQLSRFYGLRDDRALHIARVVSPILIVLTLFCVLPIGALAHALVPPGAIEDSDLVIPYLLGTADLFGPTLSAFFLLVLLSAAMSSLDSVLLVAASAVSRDLLIIDDDDTRAIARTRVWVVVVSLISMMLALNPFGDIVEITAFSGSLYAACFLPTLVMGLYWRRGTATGALACIILGSATVIGWHFAARAGWTSLHEVYVGFAVALVAYIGASLLTAPSARVDGEQVP